MKIKIEFDHFFGKPRTDRNEYIKMSGRDEKRVVMAYADGAPIASVTLDKFTKHFGPGEMIGTDEEKAQVIQLVVQKDSVLMISCRDRVSHNGCKRCLNFNCPISAEMRNRQVNS